MSATTVDVSSTGILFTLSDYLPVGTELDWELRLPAEATGIAVDVSVVCRGRVAWAVDERPVRMAATIDRYRIEEKSQ